MTCPDCFNDSGIKVTCIFDVIQMGSVCPNCSRVYRPLDGSNKHYLTKKAAMAAMRRDRATKPMLSVSTLALTERILQGRI